MQSLIMNAQRSLVLVVKSDDGRAASPATALSEAYVSWFQVVFLRLSSHLRVRLSLYR